MPIEKAIRMTATEKLELQLLRGTIRKAVYVQAGKVLFNVGQYTCKAFGKVADEEKKLEGQHIAMFGEWERLRKYPNIEEFIRNGIYNGTAFQTSVPTPVPTSTVNSGSGSRAEEVISDRIPTTSPELPLKITPAPKKEPIEATLSRATRSLIHCMRDVTTPEELEEIINTSRDTFKVEAAKILLKEFRDRIIAVQLEEQTQSIF